MLKPSQHQLASAWEPFEKWLFQHHLKLSDDYHGQHVVNNLIKDSELKPPGIKPLRNSETVRHIQKLWEIIFIVFKLLIQFSRSVVYDSLRPHEPQHARPPCPSPIPGVYPNSCPLNQWCHPTILSSVISFSSCPQSFPASGSFQMSQLVASRGQSIVISAWTSF